MKARSQRNRQTHAVTLLEGTPVPSASGDLAPVMAGIARSAAHLCRATRAAILVRDGDVARIVASHGGGARPGGAGVVPIDRNWPGGDAIVRARRVHVRDLGDAVARGRYDATRVRQGGWRGRTGTVLAVPLLVGGHAAGAIVAERTRVEPFSAQEQADLQTLAGHTALAIEKAGIEEALAARDAELAQAVERETATGGVLRLIGESSSDLRPMFEAIVTDAARLCDAQNAQIFQVEGDRMRLAARCG